MGGILMLPKEGGGLYHLATPEFNTDRQAEGIPFMNFTS